MATGDFSRVKHSQMLSQHRLKGIGINDKELMTKRNVPSLRIKAVGWKGKLAPSAYASGRARAWKPSSAGLHRRSKRISVTVTEFVLERWQACACPDRRERIPVRHHWGERPGRSQMMVR
jgi:hypothetical protein